MKVKVLLTSCPGSGVTDMSRSPWNTTDPTNHGEWVGGELCDGLMSCTYHTTHNRASTSLQEVCVAGTGHN
jgi:hypothetical protein